jgi:ABC-type multidrug transport system fused ATPase/permease subunit
LFAWIAVFAINSGVGSFRRSYDQRVYLDMFTELATTISRTGTVRNLSVSTTAARAELSREYITFFQYRVPEIIEQAIGIGGALIALTFYDPRIAASCALIVVPLLFVYRVYRTRVRRLQATVHDRLEQTYDVFQTGDPDRVRTYYGELALSQQKIANVGALTFGAMRVFLLGIFLVVLYVAIDLDNLSTGTIYSVVAYIWTFVTSAEYLPELMESWGSLKDISHRLQVGEVEPAD